MEIIQTEVKNFVAVESNEPDEIVVTQTGEVSAISVVTGNGDQGPVGPQGPAGPAGANGADGADGVGVPVGGTVGQYLRKQSSTDFDTAWASFPTETDPADFTLVYSGANQSNVTVVSAKWFRQKKYLFMEFHVEFTGAAGTGSVWTIDLPIVDAAQLQVDTSFGGGGSSTTNAGRSNFGWATWFQAGVGWKIVHVQYESATKLRFAENPGYITDNQLTSSGQNSSIKTNYVRIPIQGWS